MVGVDVTSASDIRIRGVCNKIPVNIPSINSRYKVPIGFGCRRGSIVMYNNKLRPVLDIYRWVENDCRFVAGKAKYRDINIGMVVNRNDVDLVVI